MCSRLGCSNACGEGADNPLPRLRSPPLSMVTAASGAYAPAVGASSGRFKGMSPCRVRKACQHQDALSEISLSADRSWRKSPLDSRSTANFFLEQQDSVEQRFRAWRAPGDIDVNRHNPVASAHHGVGVVIV